MIIPIFVLDSGEKWRPVSVDQTLRVGAKIDGKPLTSLEQLTGDTKRIDFPATMRQPADAPIGVYHRAAQAGGLWWQQFWVWWLYNPKQYAGFGAHEGDWEMVQVGCVDQAGTKPVLMTCSQHSGGEKREYWRVQLHESRPVVYVAAGSHANYFATCHDVTDDADGKGQRLAPVNVWELGPWAGWNGRWGNSENSPGGLAQRRAWLAPHAWHGQARG
jgi:hypothetical protein